MPGPHRAGALAKHRVGFVEEQERAACLGGIEDIGEVFLGLADPLRDHLAEVDLAQVEFLGD